MKRVNSESNAKQGLSIAESCASSTTVNTEIINNETKALAERIKNTLEQTGASAWAEQGFENYATADGEETWV